MTESQALHRLAAYCSKAERCTSDILKKMDVWELDEPVKNSILLHLIQEKFLDEGRYAAAFVKDKSRFSKWGKMKIKYELKKKQIPENIIQEALLEIDDCQSNEVLIEMLSKKNQSVKAKDGYERKVKLMRFAIGRGFEMDAIRKCLEQIVKDETSDFE